MTLQISLAPSDLRHARTTLPHQLRVWGEQVDEVLFTVDTLRPRGATRFGRAWAAQEPELLRFLEEQARAHPRARVEEVDYGARAATDVAERFFGGAAVPPKDSRGGPFYSYFYGVAAAQHDHVLHVDSDMLFGGGSRSWMVEATAVLSEPEVFAVNPLGGPPLHDLARWRDPPFDHPTPAFRCDSLSTRVFVIDRRALTAVRPLELREPARLRSRIKAAVHRNPAVAMPEDLLTDAMLAAGMIRVDLLGAAPGMWSIHPRSRSTAFYASLDQVVSRIEAGDIPDAQRGDFDLSDLFIDASAP